MTRDPEMAAWRPDDAPAFDFYKLGAAIAAAVFLVTGWIAAVGTLGRHLGCW